MAISVAKQYCPDFSSLIDPFRTIQSFDYFGTHTDQMEFTISTNISDEVCEINDHACLAITFIRFVINYYHLFGMRLDFRLKFVLI